MTKLSELADRVSGLHGKLANCHPSLSRGQVWCRTCGATLLLNTASAIASGWPKCCGYTMTIDSPAEQASLRARDGGEG